ncbi:GAF domain-like protein [Xylaria castorea]|nr:GAF domain-like protein [Xylaria castorea]
MALGALSIACLTNVNFLRDSRAHMSVPEEWYNLITYLKREKENSKDVGSVYQVHADSSNFAQGVTKEEANLANTASLLWHAYKSLPAPSSQVNWAGFYTLDATKPQQLILGPFQGKVACQTIMFGRGVCGAAASTRTTQLVPDVEKFPGHIACDGDSKSEIVVPVVAGEKVVAIIDIDCAELDGFDEVDRKFLEKLAELLGGACDW